MTAFHESSCRLQAAVDRLCSVVKITLQSLLQTTMIEFPERGSDTFHGKTSLSLE